MSEKAAQAGEGTPIQGEITVESLAREQGWVPPDEYRGDEGRPPISAEDYLRKGFEIRGSMKNRIENMDGQLASMRNAMGKLTEHYERKTKSEIAKAREEIMAEKDAAIEDGDKEAVRAADKKLDDLRTEETAIEPSKRQPGEVSGDQTPVFKEWHEKNNWYGRDRAMSAVAEDAADRFYTDNPGAPESQMLAHVRGIVEQEFPQKLSDPGDRGGNGTASPVEGAHRNAGHAQNKTFTERDLSPEQLQVMNTMINGGAPITKEQYIKDLVAMGELQQ